MTKEIGSETYMDTSVDFENIVQQALAERLRLINGLDYKIYLVENKDQHLHGIIIRSLLKSKPSIVIFLARVQNNKVFIEVDKSSNPEIPLYKALMSKGIPREYMVLEYLGEEDPDEYHR